MRKHSAFQSFRDNNYRRLNLIELSPREENTRAENLENFGTPAEKAEPTPPKVELPQGPAAAFEDSPSPTPDLLEQITRLRELHDAGILTQGEYQKQKEKLLG
jgi:hypothetical protein